MLNLNEISKTIENLTKEIEAKKQILLNLKKIQKSLEVLEGLGVGVKKQKTRKTKSGAAKEQKQVTKGRQRTKASTGGISKELEEDIRKMMKKTTEAVTQASNRADEIMKEFLE